MAEISARGASGDNTLKRRAWFESSETLLPICSLLSRGTGLLQGHSAARSRLCQGKLAVPRKGLAEVSEVLYRLSQGSDEKLGG